jgi:excisionase family DNA binding protein
MSLLTVTQVAERLQCSVSTVYSLIESGRMGHHRCPGIRVSEVQLSTYLEETERGPVPRQGKTGPRRRLKFIKL